MEKGATGNGRAFFLPTKADIATGTSGRHSVCMKQIGTMAAISALLAPASIVRADTQKPSLKIGDEYEISKSYETSQQTDDGSSSGSSSGRDTILERVIAVRDAGLELEYDLPKDATAADRARSWQFPARVFKPSHGQMQLLNHQQLDERLEGWLKAAKWTRAHCGRWIFTWNAFRIECDPQSVIKKIEAFDLSSADLRDGAEYRENGTRSAAALAKKTAGPNGATFAAMMEVDPDAVRRTRAESDVVVGEIMQKPVTLDAALRARAKESISGTISVTFETDSLGQAWRRTIVTKLKTKGQNGQSEIESMKEETERKLVSVR